MYEIIISDECEEAIAAAAKEWAISLELEAIQVALTRRERTITAEHVQLAVVTMRRWER